MQNMQNLPNKPTKPNLPNQTYQTNHTKPNLPNKIYWSKQSTPGSVVPLAMFELVFYFVVYVKIFYIVFYMKYSPILFAQLYHDYVRCEIFFYWNSPWKWNHLCLFLPLQHGHFPDVAGSFASNHLKRESDCSLKNWRKKSRKRKWLPCHLPKIEYMKNMNSRTSQLVLNSAPASWAAHTWEMARSHGST